MYRCCAPTRRDARGNYYTKKAAAVLWNSSSDYYKNWQQKEDGWVELCGIFIPNHTERSDEEKLQIVGSIMPPNESPAHDFTADGAYDELRRKNHQPFCIECNKDLYRIMPNVNSMSHCQLKDGFLRLFGDNVYLKSMLHEQEDTIKRLSGRLIRLKEIFKYRLKNPENRNKLRYDELVDAQIVRIRELEVSNKKLDGRAHALKTQLTSQIKFFPQQYETINVCGGEYSNVEMNHCGTQTGESLCSDLSVSSDAIQTQDSASPHPTSEELSTSSSYTPTRRCMNKSQIANDDKSDTVSNSSLES